MSTQTTTGPLFTTSLHPLTGQEINDGTLIIGTRVTSVIKTGETPEGCAFLLTVKGEGLDGIEQFIGDSNELLTAGLEVTDDQSDGWDL